MLFLEKIFKKIIKTKYKIMKHKSASKFKLLKIEEVNHLLNKKISITKVNPKLIKNDKNK